MNLRDEAQQLAIFFVPVLIVAAAANVWSADVMQSYLDSIGTPGQSNELLRASSILKLIPLLAAAGPNIVVGIWLFFRAKSAKYSSILWCIFGFSSGVFAATIYFIVRLSEQYPFNKKKQADA